MIPPDEGQPYRLQAWLLRVSLVSNGVAAVLVLLLGTALAVVAHRDTVKPFFVTADLATSRVFKVEPLYATSTSFDLVARTLARQYVTLREPLDFKTEDDRWSRASWFASGDVSDEFKKLMEGKESPLKTFPGRRRTREVHIISASPVALLDSRGPRRTFLVEFKTTDKESGKIVEEVERVATVVLEAKTSEVRYDDALLNPYGMIVIAYSVERKGSSK